MTFKHNYKKLYIFIDRVKRVYNIIIIKKNLIIYIYKNNNTNYNYHKTIKFSSY